MLSRRRLLHGFSTTVGISLTGCTALDVSVNCDGRDQVEFTDYDLDAGRNAGFELTASEQTVSPGDTLTFRLRNRTPRTLHTATASTHSIQRRRDRGWEHVLSTGGADGEAVAQEPGTGYDWTFDIGRRRFSRPDLDAEATTRELCIPMTPGQYRFVYFGLPDTASGDSQAVAVQFAVAK